MSLISVPQVQDGVTGVNASAINTPVNTIADDYNGNITDANVASAAAIAQSKVALSLTGAKTSTVATSETTTSTSYTDLATVGPSCTAIIGSTGMALVMMNSSIDLSSSGSRATISFVASGANTIAVGTYAFNTRVYASSGGGFTNGITFLLTGLTAGSTTFKMQYQVQAGTGTFVARNLTVVPL